MSKASRRRRRYPVRQPQAKPAPIKLTISMPKIELIPRIKSLPPKLGTTVRRAILAPPKIKKRPLRQETKPDVKTQMTLRRERRESYKDEVIEKKETETCKPRPDGKKRLGGGAKRSWVPWCGRKK